MNEDTFLFSNACSGSDALDVGNLMKQAGATYVAWDRPVSNKGAVDAAKRFYEETMVNGRQVDAVWGTLDDEGLTEVTWTPSTRPITAHLLLTGGQRHLREVVELVRDGVRMEDGAPITLIGVPGDGRPDKLHVEARVLGVEPGQEGEWHVDVQFDGVPSPTPLEVRQGRKERDYVWIVSGDIDLAQDVSDIPQHTLVARVDAAKSAHTVSVTLGGPRIELSSELSILGQGIEAHQTVTSVVPLVQRPDGSYTGMGPVDYMHYEALVPPGCTAVATDLSTGSLVVLSLTAPGGALEAGVPPDEVQLAVAAPGAVVTLSCKGHEVDLPDSYWGAGFLTSMVQTGQLDEGLGYVLAPGTPGTEPGEAASWEVHFDRVDPDAVFDITTQIRVFAE